MTAALTMYFICDVSQNFSLCACITFERPRKTRMCTLWICKSTTRKAKLLWMTSLYGQSLYEVSRNPSSNPNLILDLLNPKSIGFDRIIKFQFEKHRCIKIKDTVSLSLTLLSTARLTTPETRQKKYHSHDTLNVLYRSV